MFSLDQMRKNLTQDTSIYNELTQQLIESARNDTSSFADDDQSHEAKVVIAFITKIHLNFNKDKTRLEKTMMAVKEDVLALEFAPDELRNDKGIVFAAVTQCRKALEFASPALQNDKLLVLSFTVKRIFTRFRWPRLVKTVLQFEREAFLAGGDEVGPQPPSLWLAIINKKRGRIIL
jgi:hypothetical protein